MDKAREEFEAWFEANKDFMLGVRKVSKGDCFFIWQASRAALVIDLPVLGPAPEAPDDAFDDRYMDAHHAGNRMRNLCCLAIESAGVKVKVKQ